MRWRSWIAVVLVAIPLVFSLVDLSQEAPASVEIVTSVRGIGELSVGAGKAEVDLPEEIPLAGYRPFGRSPKEGREPLFARALLLDVGGRRAGLVLLELMTLPPSLADRIASRLEKEGIGCSLIAASHTHSGPGAYDRAFLPQAVAVGRYDERVEDALVEAVHAAVVAARAGLAPATLAVGEAEIGIAHNRDREGALVDDRLTRLSFKRRGGGTLATVLRATAHPTISPREVGPHGDWPGVTMREVEAGGGIAFVLQGAVGDARAKGKDKETFGAEIASLVRQVSEGRGERTLELGCAVAELTLPPPDLSAMVPKVFSRLVGNAALPFAPKTVRMAGLRLGDWTLLGVPAEPTSRLGMRLEGIASASGHLRVTSLAQGYVGYGVEKEDMEGRVFSARNAWFGENLAPRLVEGGRAIAGELGLLEGWEKRRIAPASPGH